jgi:flagellar assembly factor FliW
MNSTARLTVRSHYFEQMDLDPAAAFEFAGGLPGLERERLFAPIEIPEQRPLLYLQSLNERSLCLITLPVRAIDRDYTLHLLPDQLDLLGIPRGRQPRIGEDLLCLAIVTARGSGRLMANLLAPIVVNIRTRQALQAIQYDSPYDYRHPLPAAGMTAPC